MRLYPITSCHEDEAKVTDNLSLEQYYAVYTKLTAQLISYNIDRSTHSIIRPRHGEMGISKSATS